MWAAIASFIVGGVGWWLAKFLFEPWKEIADYRREAQEALILYGNLAKTAPPEERATASGAFRRIGAALISRHLAAYPWVQWWYRRVLAWDVHNPGAALIGVGNATQFDGFSMTNRPSLWIIYSRAVGRQTTEPVLSDHDLLHQD